MLKGPEKRLAQQAYEQLLELVLSGSLPPGDLINERRLAETLGMSRTPIRDALLILEGEGLVVRQGNRGLQVKQMRVEDFMDALQVRLLLEPEVTRMAAGRIDDAAWAPLIARLEDLLANGIGGETDRTEVRDIDNQLHSLIAEAAGNAQLTGIIRTLRQQTQIFDLKSLPERREDTCKEHLEIIGHLRKGDGEAAAGAMAAHLEAVRQSIIRRLSGA